MSYIDRQDPEGLLPRHADRIPGGCLLCLYLASEPAEGRCPECGRRYGQ